MLGEVLLDAAAIDGPGPAYRLAAPIRNDGVETAPVLWRLLAFQQAFRFQPVDEPAEAAPRQHRALCQFMQPQTVLLGPDQWQQHVVPGQRYLPGLCKITLDTPDNARVHIEQSAPRGDSR